MRDPFRACLVAVLLSAIPLPVSATGSAASAGPTSPLSASTGAGVPPGDEVTAATAGPGGYQLFAASSGDGWRWHALATLGPAAAGDGPWIGERCLTGDGRYVVAVVAPWAAQNRAEGIAMGGTAYAVDARTGAVRPLASGVALAYYDPGCGPAGTVALTRFPSPDQSRTEVLLADAATGAVSSAGVVPGQLTSAIPAGDGALAALGSRLVRVRGASVETVAELPGQVFRLTPGVSGGASFLVERPVAAGDQQADVYTYEGGAVRLVATGSLSSVRLFPGGGGRSFVAGARSEGPARAAGIAGDVLPATTPAAAVDISSGGQVALKETGDTASPVELVRLADGTSVGGRLPAPAPPTLLPAPLLAATASFPPSPNTTAPTCAIPRNDPRYQVPQPSSAMIEWAATLAAHGDLVGRRGAPLRRDGQFNLRTGSYSPSADLPLLGSFGARGNHVPREIMNGVFAQESTWHHASPRAPQGMAGNPYIADYYGFNATGSIDFDLAGCAYGLGQIFDLMHLPAPAAAPTALQQRIAVDYAEDAAASARILTAKWSALSAAGITVDGGAPAGIEEWYLSLWAYNTGINPQAATGGGGCDPSPTCTDPSGNWGLGWTNNPANPNYDPQRHAFLHTGDGIASPAVATYGDSVHGQDWPYQEKVLGWMETPVLEPDGSTPRYAGTFDYATQTGFFLDRPGRQAFCTAASSCSPGAAGSGGTCARADLHCWWHEPISICPGGRCHPGVDTVSDTAPEPSVADPLPPVCESTLPLAAIVVDDEASGLNLAGCRREGRRSGGSFRWLPNSDSLGAPLGLFDLHQLGAGFGGRMLFTHTEPDAFASFGGTGVWTPRLEEGRYEVMVFVPDAAAVARASYAVDAGAGTGPVQVVVDQSVFSNQWVSLGCFGLRPGSRVSLSSVTPDGDGVTDIAFDAVAFVPRPHDQVLAFHSGPEKALGLKPESHAAWAYSTFCQ
jgi:hypothetical protein